MKKRLLAVIISALVISTSMLAGCGCENKTATADEATTSVSETHEVSDTSSTTATEATLSATDKAIVDAGLKFDDKGNITDKNGKKVDVKDGKVEVKTEDGKTMTVSVSEVSTANENNSKINTSTSSKSTSKTSTASSSTNKNSSSSSKTESSSNTSNKNNSSTSSSSSKSESSKVWHEAVYKTVNHPAETKKVWVVDKAAYTYEEPIYEERDRTICNECGADITENLIPHMKNHILNGENGSYRNEWVNVQVGTKTVEVPEEGHWETKVVKEAWTEKVIVKEAGYY